MTIKELQNKVQDDWNHNSKLQPTSQQKLLFVIEEFGEVAEAIRKQTKSADYKVDDGKLGSEFADLFISLITLANEYSVDLEVEIDGFWKKMAERRSHA